MNASIYRDMYRNDTIAAISTPRGYGGIGIVKISGRDAVSTVSRFFKSKHFSAAYPVSHRLYYGIVYDPDENAAIDEALVSYMEGPRSYTAEDIVEINCHSGLAVIEKILQIACRCGARPAEAGEFTKRAFLNGRIDLAKAEAVIDIIESQTEAGLKIASRQLGGTLSRHLYEIRDSLIEIKALVEADIDFCEDETSCISAEELIEKSCSAISKINKLLATYESGRIQRRGVDVVIAGKPNVGKSSLLNALVCSDRAIVTPVPGTTRDIIGETVIMDGFQINLYDTAGVHDGADMIEALGMERTSEKISSSDLVIFVVDGSAAFDGNDRKICKTVNNVQAITVINKSDLPQITDHSQFPKHMHALKPLHVSAKCGTGIGALKDMIVRRVRSGVQCSHNGIVLTNERHKDALMRCRDSLLRFQDAAGKHAPSELAAVDLHEALNMLGEITGECVPDDVLDSVFSRFCIGK